MRFVCLDIETNGLPVRPVGKDRFMVVPHADKPLPFSSFPIQISVHIVDHGVVEHAFTTCIQGATQLAPWVREKVPVSLEDIKGGKTVTAVMVDLAELLRDGDMIVSHNIAHDLDTVLARASKNLEIDHYPFVKRVLAMHRFCTMRCEYTSSVFGTRPPSLEHLCVHFGVSLENAHDAQADCLALAQCVAEAWRRGVMLPRTPLTDVGIKRRYLDEVDVDDEDDETVSVEEEEEETDEDTQYLWSKADWKRIIRLIELDRESALLKRKLPQRPRRRKKKPPD